MADADHHQPAPSRSSYHRARRPGEQQERRTAILQAARRCLVDGVAPLSLSVADMTGEAGLAPSSFYTYFNGRESALLDLLGRELEAWVDALADVLDTVEAGDRGGAVDAVVRSLEGRASFLDLLVSLPALVEAADPVDLAAFKTNIVVVVRRLVRIVGVRLNQPERADDVVRYLRALIVGLWSTGAPSGALSGPVDDDGQVFADWFSRELTASFGALLIGLDSPNTGRGE